MGFFSLLADARNLAPFTLRECQKARTEISKVRQYKESVFKLCSVCIAPAPIATKFMIQGGGSQEKITELVFGLNENILSHKEKTNRKETKTKCFKIGYFGSLERRKGAQIIIDAFCQIPESYAAALFISTSAPNVISVFRHVKNKKRAWGLYKKKRIEIKLNQNNEEFYNSMGDVDLTVITSLYHECISLVLLEALAQETPCLVTEGLGMSHIVKPGISGDSFPPGDIEALRDKLIEILNNTSVVNEWKKNRYKPYSMREYVNRLVPILEEVVKK